jgi:hypothetical protein
MNTITLDPLLVSLIAGVSIPLIVAFGTKVHASASVKAAVTVVLSAVVGTLNAIVNQHGTFDWKAAGTSTLITIVSGMSSYTGFWKPVVNINDHAAPGVGIGPKVALDAPLTAPPADLIP